MPEVNIYHPCITRISYRQEKGDSNYGTCLWADFEFDTINYRLQITSDCGNYSYQWVPTPGKESFLDCAGESSRIIYLAKFHVKLQSTETRH